MAKAQARGRKPKTPFHTLHHLCIVVRDIDKAQRFYESIGIGPWQDYPPLDEFTTLKMPDEAGFKALKFRYCQLGPVQIQLGYPPPGNTPQRKFLETKGEGVYHVGFVVDDVDAGERAAVAMGLDPYMRGRRANGSGFTYFDAADKGGVTLSIRKSPPAQAKSARAKSTRAKSARAKSARAKSARAKSTRVKRPPVKARAKRRR